MCRGWNLRRLPDRTYLVAYLVYWLSTFVLLFGEEGLVRSELIYPVCLLADGTARIKMRMSSWLGLDSDCLLCHPLASLGLILHAAPEVENGTRLLDLWDAVAGAGKVMKLPPEGVVLLPAFSPAPSAFLPLGIRVRSGTLHVKTRMPLPMMIITPLLMERHLLMGLALYRHRPLNQVQRTLAPFLIPHTLTISSTVELSGTTPPKEGEISNWSSGESNGKSFRNPGYDFAF
ncbi:hypothetical protein Taro_027390, partial [Colocasia esculenta]|nr:hypothetical protein [Colocasia esculenta]